MVEIVLFAAVFIYIALGIEFLRKWVHHGLKYALGFLKRGAIVLTVGIVILLIFAAITSK